MDSYHRNIDTPVYHLSRYRYVNLFVFLFAGIVNSLPAQTFSSINSRVQTVFEISRVLVTLNTLLFPVLHPLCAFICSWILDHYGIKIGCTFGGVLVVAGVWMRTLLTVGNPLFCLLGSALSAIGNIFLIGSPTMFAINWFDAGSAPKVISATVLFNLLSSGLGGALGGLMLPNDATKEQIMSFLKLEAIIVTIPYIIFMLLFKEQPVHPPSSAAAHKRTNSMGSRPPYIQTLKKLFTNKAYLMICVSMSFAYGSLISFFSLINQCLTILHYEKPATVTSITLLGAMAFGTVSAFFFSYSLRKTHKYRFIISLCLLGATINFFLLQLAYSFKVQNLISLALLSGSAGFFLVPLTALFTAFAAQAAFPEGQGSITGYLFASSQTFGFLAGMVYVSWIDDVNQWKVIVVLFLHILFFLLSLIVNFFTPETLNRLKFERKNRKSKQKSESLIVPFQDQEEEGQISS